MTGETPHRVSPFVSGLRGRCPRCGRGPLFQGLLTIRERCEDCGLALRAADTGDGPAVFVIMIVGFLVVGGVLVLEIAAQPPFWFHAVVWLPTVLVLSLALLRPLKATFYALQFRHRTDVR
ncbi:MAG: DUF983 domain-containing protein [Alphaproteobacteria bacterium]|nr:DUF983 domain-containing protein [Alphaproteobacteria bacterium]